MAQQQRRSAKSCRLSVRVTPAGEEYIRREAALADVTPSHMARRMWAYAMANMPRGWVPTRVPTKGQPASQP
jgi:hypothetical protein